MAQTSVRVRTVQDACVAVGWAGHRTLTVDRPEQAGGMGLGFNGGELLLREPGRQFLPEKGGLYVCRVHTTTRSGKVRSVC